MNIVDVILYSILALSTISGMYKGFIASGLATVGFVAAWFGAMNLFPRLSALVLSNSSHDERAELLSGYLIIFQNQRAGHPPRLCRRSQSENKLLNDAIQELNLPSLIESAFQKNVTNQAFAGP